MTRAGGPAARNVLLAALAAAFALVAQIATERSYLRPAVLDANMWVFGAAWAASLLALVTLYPRVRTQGGAETGATATARYVATMVLGAAAWAALAVAMVDLCLLLAVRYAPSETVEFRSFVAQTGSRRGCSHAFSFPNVALGRETRMCGDFLPLFSPRVGDRIIVQAQAGALGATVISVRKDWSESR